MIDRCIVPHGLFGHRTSIDAPKETATDGHQTDSPEVNKETGETQEKKKMLRQNSREKKGGRK